MTAKTLTPAQAAACVKRTVVHVAKDGARSEEQVAVRANEVFDHAERDDGTVVVVTVDGRKLIGQMPNGEKTKAK